MGPRGRQSAEALIPGRGAEFEPGRSHGLLAKFRNLLVVRFFGGAHFGFEGVEVEVEAIAIGFLEFVGRPARAHRRSNQFTLEVCEAIVSGTLHRTNSSKTIERLGLRAAVGTVSFAPVL